MDHALRLRKIGGLRGGAVAVAAGVGAGVVGFLMHEWGHLAGAKLSGGVAHIPSKLTSPFLFHFNVKESTRAQFAWMSLGGFAATAVASRFIWKTVPRGALSGRIALVTTAAGIAVTVAAELPTFIRVVRGGPLPHGGVYAG